MGKIAAIILTAGNSSRMGVPKALLPMAGSTFLQHLIKLFSNFSVQAPESVIVTVVAPDAPEELLGCCNTPIAAASTIADHGRVDTTAHASTSAYTATTAIMPKHRPAVEVAVNPAPARGMFSSIQTGLAAAQERGKWDAIYITPVDCPAFAAETLTQLIQNLPEDGNGAVVPVYHGSQGHPVLIGGELAKNLLQLDATVRLDEALTQMAKPLIMVPVDDPWVLVDTDTPEDLADFYHMRLHGDKVRQ